MQKTIIVYKSKTGFTRRYAEWIARETGYELLDFKKASLSALAEYDRIVFGSRLFAGTVDGLKKFKETCRGKQLVLFATGAMPNAADNTIADIWKKNLSADELSSIPHFYMQAGLNYEKMGLAERCMMKMLSIMLSRMKNPSEADLAMARMIEKSFDASDKKYILPLIEHLKKA